MNEKLVSALEEYKKASDVLFKACEAVMEEAERTGNCKVYAYYRELVFDLSEVMHDIDNEIDKLKA